MGRRGRGGLCRNLREFALFRAGSARFYRAKPGNPKRMPSGSLLEYPRSAPPPGGETLEIAPGVHWLRMPLPFALDHINLWALEDGAGWTIVDSGLATATTKELWERIFATALGGKPVTRLIVTHFHPDHMGLAGWLTERW